MRDLAGPMGAQMSPGAEKMPRPDRVMAVPPQHSPVEGPKEPQASHASPQLEGKKEAAPGRREVAEEVEPSLPQVSDKVGVRATTHVPAEQAGVTTQTHKSGLK